MNLDKPVIQIRHSGLERSGSDSAFKSKCPVCRDGVLLVRREPHFPYKLQRDDNCIACGQRVYYLDRDIAGESLPVVN